MSRGNLEDFTTFLAEHSKSDENVAKRLEKIASGTTDDFIAYGKENGFIFDEQDMKSVTHGILEKTDELSEEDLENVAGGVFASVIALLVGPEMPKVLS